MTDHAMDAEPGRYEASGMDALLGVLRQQLSDATVSAQGIVFTPEPAVAHAEASIGNVVTLPDLLIPAAIVVTGGKVAEGQLIDAVGLAWYEIVTALKRDPNVLHQLRWRELEELAAGAYKREGWQVILTPRSGDRGRDIIASRQDWGTIRFFDQVKAYKPGHRVPADDVRALLGVLTVHPNVSKAVITTTALFAPGVVNEMKALMPYRLELKDGPRLHEWLIRLCGSAADPRGPKGAER